MKSITIHEIDERVSLLIEKKAKELGLSLNKTIKKLLEQALGIKKNPAEGRKESFKNFLGVWNKSDLCEFKMETREFEKIDPGDW